jgi:hypothetical protein
MNITKLGDSESTCEIEGSGLHVLHTPWNPCNFSKHLYSLEKLWYGLSKIVLQDSSCT